MHLLPLLAIPAAYRLKGVGLNVSRLTLFPVLGMIVGLAIVASRGEPWWWSGVYCACFIAGSIPGHDSFFGMTVNGVWSGQRGNRYVDAIVFRLFQFRPPVEPPLYVKLRGFCGLVIVSLAFLPLFLAVNPGWRGLVCGVDFALGVGWAYLLSKPIIDFITRGKPWPDAYTQCAEWVIGVLMMALLAV